MAAKKPEIKDELIRHRYVIESQDPKSKTWRFEDHWFGDHVDNWQNGVDSGETAAWQKVNRLRNDLIPGTGFSMSDLANPEYGPVYAKMMQGELAKGETHVRNNPEGRKLRVRRFGEYRQTKTDADGFTGTRVYHSGSLKEGGDVLKEPATLPSFSETEPAQSPSLLGRQLRSRMLPIRPHGNTGNPTGNLGKAVGKDPGKNKRARREAAEAAAPKKPAAKKPATKTAAAPAAKKPAAKKTTITVTPEQLAAEVAKRTGKK
jgi:hypothetical protein